MNVVSPPKEIFAVLIFVFSVGYWSHPFIVTGLTEDERWPWDMVGTLSAGLKQPSSDRAGLVHKTHVKLSTSSKVHTKVHVFKFSLFIFRIFVVGHENRENLDPAKISCYTVYVYRQFSFQIPIPIIRTSVTVPMWKLEIVLLHILQIKTDYLPSFGHRSGWLRSSDTISRAKTR